MSFQLLRGAMCIALRSELGAGLSIVIGPWSCVSEGRRINRGKKYLCWREGSQQGLVVTVE